MISVGKNNPYNKLTEGLIKKLKDHPFGRGDRKVFRLVGTYDEATKKHTLCAGRHLAEKDQVLDPETNAIVDIANIKSIKEGGEPVFFDLWFPESSLNKEILDGARSIDILKYEYFVLTNLNASNPDRDTDRMAIIEEEDEERAARVRRANKRTKRSAVAVVDNMDDSEIIRYWASKGENPKIENIEDWREKLEDMAYEQPDTFIGSGGSAKEEVKENLKILAKKDVIVYDMKTGVWTFTESGEEITKLKRGFGMKQYDGLVDYVLDTNEGGKFYEDMKAVFN